MKFKLAVCQMISGVVEIELLNPDGIVCRVDGEPFFHPSLLAVGLPPMSADLKEQIKAAAHMAMADHLAKATKAACNAPIERVEDIQTKASA